MTPAVVTPHVKLDSAGVAWISGTTLKVRELVLEHVAHGWSPEEIHFQHGAGVSMAKIHAALSYYYDHQAAIDAEMDREIEFVETLRSRQGPSALRARLKQTPRSA